MMKVKAVIFDMDGVIIDSESFWQQAQIAALATWNATASVAECEALTKGKRLDEIARVWCERFNLPVPSAQVEQAILCRLTALISDKGEAMPGVTEALNRFRQQGYRIALATSSSHQVIEAVFRKLQLQHYFDVVSSADDEPHGKPHPAVYLATARRLNLPVEACMVIEDSANGFRAAQAAGMRTLVVSEVCYRPCFSGAAGRYRSLLDALAALPLTHLSPTLA